MPACLVLLGAGSATAGSESNLARIAASHPIALLDTTAPSWARPYLTSHITADAADYPTAAAAVKNYQAHHEISGVLTYMEEHLVTAACVARQLRLPSVSVASATACRDLVGLRRILAQHKVSQPRWAEALDPETAAMQADALGYPVALKPATGTNASAVRATNRREVLEGYERVLQDSSGGASMQPQRVLVEEHLDGPCISAETVVLDGSDVRIVAITRTTSAPAPSQQSIRHCVYAHDGLLHNPVLRHIVARAVRAIDVTTGVLHITMTLTTRGPRITGIKGHLAGDFIPLLVKRATGIDLPQIAAHLATGRTPDLTPTQQRAAAVHFAYPAVTGRIQRLAISPKVAQQPLLERMVPLQQVGTHVVSMPHARTDDRLAYWLVLGCDARNCDVTLDEMTPYLSVDVAASGIASQAA